MNQWMERHRDARMPRTAKRPLPSGRLSGSEVVAFAAVTAAAGLLVHAAVWAIPRPAVALLTWVLYVLVYTPLKSRTAMNTAVGAVPGALPVLIGWTATGEPLSLGAPSLFMIVFLWQFPHFMAIAWLYRDDYRAGGMKMITVVDPSGRPRGVASRDLRLGFAAGPAWCRRCWPTRPSAAARCRTRRWRCCWAACSSLRRCGSCAAGYQSRPAACCTSLIYLAGGNAGIVAHADLIPVGFPFIHLQTRAISRRARQGRTFDP